MSDCGGDEAVTDIIVMGRRGGKTTRLLEWMKEAPEGEHRVCVSHTSDEAMRLYRSTFDESGNPTWAESWQFVGIGEVTSDAWRGVLSGRGGWVVLGIDNLDLILQGLFRRPVGLVTWTAESSAPTKPQDGIIWPQPHAERDVQ